MVFGYLLFQINLAVKNVVKKRHFVNHPSKNEIKKDARDERLFSSVSGESLRGRESIRSRVNVS